MRLSICQPPSRRAYVSERRRQHKLYETEAGQERPISLCPFSVSCLIYWTRSLKAFPGVNFTLLEAGMLIFSPVLGLRPSRAAL